MSKRGRGKNGREEREANRNSELMNVNEVYITSICHQVESFILTHMEGLNLKTNRNDTDTMLTLGLYLGALEVFKKLQSSKKCFSKLSNGFQNSLADLCEKCFDGNPKKLIGPLLVFHDKYMRGKLNWESPRLRQLANVCKELTGN